MGHQHRRLFPILWMAPVYEIDPRTTQTGDALAVLSVHILVPYGIEPERVHWLYHAPARGGQERRLPLLAECREWWYSQPRAPV
jgi:hypothetical protein